MSIHAAPTVGLVGQQHHHMSATRVQRQQSDLGQDCESQRTGTCRLGGCECQSCPCGERAFPALLRGEYSLSQWLVDFRSLDQNLRSSQCSSARCSQTMYSRLPSKLHGDIPLRRPACSITAPSEDEQSGRIMVYASAVEIRSTASETGCAY